MDSELSVVEKDEVSMRKGFCERILAKLLTQFPTLQGSLVPDVSSRALHQEED